MTNRRKHDAPAADVAAPVRQLAPVERHDDDAPVDPVAAPIEYAHVFPTDEQVAAVTAQLIADDPSLATQSHHVLARVLHPALAKEAERLSRARHRTAALTTLAAPVFPTEAHELALRAAIPTIADADAKAVLNAGHAAFLASVAAGEPITQPPTDEESAA